MARKLMIEVAAWDLKRYDVVETEHGLCTVIRARKSKEYGPGQGIEIEMECGDPPKIVAMTVDATERLRIDARSRRR